MTEKNGCNWIMNLKNSTSLEDEDKRGKGM